MRFIIRTVMLIALVWIGLLLSGYGVLISAEKMISPRDKLVNGTNSAEKLYILIAHHVEYLRPKQQASQHHDNQNDPSKLFHSNLRFTYLMSLN